MTGIISKINVAKVNRDIYYRIGTTDENCIREVLIKQCYKNKNVPFFVEKDEVWLDLGSHIGTFAIYAYSKGAKKVYCFEGDEWNFKLLEMNCPEAEKYNKFFTTEIVDKLPIYRPTKESDHYRFSIIKNKRFGYFADNYYAGNFKEKIDGIKMDIEGAELGLIDKELLPEAKKLVMEYHFSKDDLMSNFFMRMDLLRKRYRIVYYPKSLDKYRGKENEHYKGFYDIVVYCII